MQILAQQEIYTLPVLTQIHIQDNRLSQKKLTRCAGNVIKDMRAIMKIIALVYHLKANLDV